MALLDHGNAGAIQADLNALPLQRADNDNTRNNAPELDCLKGLFPAGLLRAAARRAHIIGVGADRVLIQDGVLTEEAYVACLARTTGLRFNRLTESMDAARNLPAEAAEQAAATGILPIRRNDALVYVIAPRNSGARGLATLVARHPDVAMRIELTTTRHLHRLLFRAYGPAMAKRAADGLQHAHPGFSAADSADGRSHQIWRGLRIACVAMLASLPPLLAEPTVTSALALCFLGFIALRLVACAMPAEVPPAKARLRDAELPVYSVIIALYREASSVAPLLQAIDALDYPREKLDVIIVIEMDDAPTREAIALSGLMPHLRVLTAPDIAPRTKPKALNYALPLSRGSYIAVFDAEDRPDRDQLRKALNGFRTDDNLACMQAALCIDNGGEGALSRIFAAEYAVQFDLFLPGLAAMRLPLPLGGSSNHFRADVLRAAGGWDAHNVTEDADLGIRLARCGYRSGTFASTTYEEAPIHVGGWLRQRTRWMKGWMQTFGVHMRSPRKLWRDAGLRGFVSINLIVGGNVLTALAYPTLLAGLLIAMLSGGGPFTGPETPLHIAAIAAGVLSTIGLGLIGLARRGQLRHGWVLLLAPLYWGLLSAAAWRALWQLWRAPTRWEKTEHGLSRRRGRMRPAARKLP